MSLSSNAHLAESFVGTMMSEKPAPGGIASGGIVSTQGTQEQLALSNW